VTGHRGQPATDLLGLEFQTLIGLGFGLTVGLAADRGASFAPSSAVISMIPPRPHAYPVHRPGGGLGLGELSKVM